MDEIPRPKGGPKTRQGKRTSSANALKHDVTAAKLLPVVVGSGSLEELRREFLLEYARKSATERHLIDELARHAAMLGRVLPEDQPRDLAIRAVIWPDTSLERPPAHWVNQTIDD